MDNTYNKSNLELVNKNVGSKLLAYILGITSTKYINSDNNELIEIFTNDIRFITLMEIIEIVEVGNNNNNCSPITFQSWLQGINAHFNAAPARVLRHINNANDPNITELKIAARSLIYL